MKPEFEKLVASALAFIKNLAGNYPLVALAHKSTGVCIVHWVWKQDMYFKIIER